MLCISEINVASTYYDEENRNLPAHIVVCLTCSGDIQMLPVQSLYTR